MSWHRRPGSRVLLYVPAGLCETEDRGREQKSEGAQVHHPVLGEWLEMRLDKGMLGPEVKHLNAWPTSFSLDPVGCTTEGVK